MDHGRDDGFDRELNRAMREIALTNDNVLTTDDLFDLGLTPRMVRIRADSGRLIPIMKGSFALPGARLRLRGRCRAAAASVNEKVAVSHASALALHGLVRDPGIVHLSGTAGVFRTPGRWESSTFGFKVIRHETRFLPPEHLVPVNGIRATTVERALRDFASTASRREIAGALTQGEKERSFCWDQLRKLVAESNGHRGMTILEAEIEAWDEAFVDTASEPEIDFLIMVRNAELPMPEVNVKVGSYVPDFLWRHLNLAVELDPYGTHSGLATHRQDHRKGIELEIRGLRVVRFTGEDISRHKSRTTNELLVVMKQQARLLQRSIFTDSGN